MVTPGISTGIGSLVFSSLYAYSIHDLDLSWLAFVVAAFLFALVAIYLYYLFVYDMKIYDGKEEEAEVMYSSIDTDERVTNELYHPSLDTTHTHMSIDAKSTLYGNNDSNKDADNGNDDKIQPSDDKYANGGNDSIKSDDITTT